MRCVVEPNKVGSLVIAAIYTDCGAVRADDEDRGITAGSLRSTGRDGPSLREAADGSEGRAIINGMVESLRVEGVRGRAGQAPQRLTLSVDTQTSPEVPVLTTMSLAEVDVPRVPAEVAKVTPKSVET